MNVTHVLFDFFGTLVEYSESRTDQGYEQSHAILRSNGSGLEYPAFLEKWSATFSDFDAQSRVDHNEFSMDDVVIEFLKEVFRDDPAAELVGAFQDAYIQEWNKGVRYIDGVTSMLHELAGQYTLALVTNTHSADLIHAHLRRMDLAGTFSLVVTSVEHGKRKPDASIFQSALHLTAGRHDTAVYVGDSFDADYTGARNVGMRCLLVDPERRQSIPDSERIASVLDIQEILRVG